MLRVRAVSSHAPQASVSNYAIESPYHRQAYSSHSDRPLIESHTECSRLGLGQGSVGNPFPCSPSPTMVFCCLLLSSFFLSADLCSSPRCFRSTALLTVASLAQRDHWAGRGFSVSVLWLQKDILYISRQRVLWLLGYLSQELQYSVAYYPVPENSSLRDFVQFLLVSGREVNLVPVNPA